jgi:hypothetical protein
MDLARYTKSYVLKAVSNKISSSSMCHMNSKMSRCKHFEGHFCLRLKLDITFLLNAGT